MTLDSDRRRLGAALREFVNACRRSISKPSQPARPAIVRYAHAAKDVTCVKVVDGIVVELPLGYALETNDVVWRVVSLGNPLLAVLDTWEAAVNYAWEHHKAMERERACRERTWRRLEKL